MRLAGFLVLLAGCATTTVTPAGPSVTRVSDEAQVCGDARGLHTGDAIRIQRQKCAPLNAKSSVVHCVVADVDRGEVVRVVDDHCAVVRVATGAEVQPGDTWTRAQGDLRSERAP